MKLSKSSRIALFALPFLAPGGAGAGAGAFCVLNASESAYYLTAEAAEGTRRGQWLAPGDALCLRGEQGGAVSAFVDENAIEGCSRLVVDGQIEQLLAYSEFDRCRWASNDG